MMSLLPPGACGTITRIGLTGNCGAPSFCAACAPPAQVKTTTIDAAINRFMHASPPGHPGWGYHTAREARVLDNRPEERAMTEMTMLAKAEAADHAAAAAMDRLNIVKSAIYTSGERDPRKPPERQEARGRLHLMSHDPRLSRMPERPTIIDFFKHRFGPATHLLQSARLAQ